MLVLTHSLYVLNSKQQMPPKGSRRGFRPTTEHKRSSSPAQPPRMISVPKEINGDTLLVNMATLQSTPESAEDDIKFFTAWNKRVTDASAECDREMKQQTDIHCEGEVLLSKMDSAASFRLRYGGLSRMSPPLWAKRSELIYLNRMAGKRHPYNFYDCNVKGCRNTALTLLGRCFICCHALSSHGTDAARSAAALMNSAMPGSI